MKRTPMTMRGAEALRAELKRLKSEARPNIIKAIAEARGHGDLSENAEYHAAREQQGFIEGRIKEIERKLATAEVIDTSKLPNTGKVVFGFHGATYSGDASKRTLLDYFDRLDARLEEQLRVIGVNRSKRGVVLDLKTPEGLAHLMRLVRDADVLVHNFRPSVPKLLYRFRSRKKLKFWVLSSSESQR